ncbi:hypothetical protein Scani_30450 [Streptomyces caniferus]|uniref:Uncharacterized protein n=1 Tax=Streptomyces caniferus TaxID=285557 RepID=A0A640S6U9_9ACTN|nr:hypothetical protein Scani_30450 [Streptomyces caniferus]
MLKYFRTTTQCGDRSAAAAVEALVIVKVALHATAASAIAMIFRT